MLWWNNKRDRELDALKVDLIVVLKDEIAVLRKRHDLDCQRIDRLTEALARRANVDLVMPLPELAPVPQPIVRNPWKDPNQVTSIFPEDEGGNKQAATAIPKFSKETK